MLIPRATVAYHGNPRANTQPGVVLTGEPMFIAKVSEDGGSRIIWRRNRANELPNYALIELPSLGKLVGRSTGLKRMTVVDRGVEIVHYNRQISL